MENFHIVYDFANQSRTNYNCFPVFLGIVGIISFFYFALFFEKNSNPFSPNSSRKKGMIFGFIAILISGFLIQGMYLEYSKTKKHYANKNYKIVEGIVENFHPMPKGGRDSERFTVNKVKFEFSDFDNNNYGYNNTASHGGAIKKNLKVRITYFNNGRTNIILKLEVQ